MTVPTKRRPWLFAAVAALAQLALWLVLRPDRCGPQWTDGLRLELWLALEAVAAVAIGCVARRRGTAAAAVGLGWLLQLLHFGFVGEHYASDLWGVGLFAQAVLGGGCVALALLAVQLVRLRRRRAG